jgi:hypothetical protein
MVTATGTSRSNVSHTVAVSRTCAYQQTPEMIQILAVGSGIASFVPH